MSWAAKRVTTRRKDVTYCLLGLFDVNIPLLYGEGGKAFTRLHIVIMEADHDHTIFARNYGTPATRSAQIELGCLARHPSEFGNGHLITHEWRWQGGGISYHFSTNIGIQITLQVIDIPDSMGVCLHALIVGTNAHRSTQHVVSPSRYGHRVYAINCIKKNPLQNHPLLIESSAFDNARAQLMYLRTDPFPLYTFNDATSCVL